MRVDTSAPTAISSSSSPSSICYSELSFFIRDSSTLRYICEFLRRNVVNPEATDSNWWTLVSSQVMRYFLSCFKLYQRRPVNSSPNEKPPPESHRPDFHSLVFNSDLIIGEMRLCYDQAAAFKVRNIKVTIS